MHLDTNTPAGRWRRRPLAVAGSRTCALAGTRPAVIRCFAAAGGVLLLFSLLLASGAAAEDRVKRHPERIPARRVTAGELQRTAEGRRVIEKERIRQRVTGERWQAVHELLGNRQYSRKSHELLRRRGLGPALVMSEDGSKALPLAQAVTGVDTLRVILVRIAYATNRRPDLTTVPADGGFMLEELPPPGDGSFVADPPPHDRAYFESHLHGLAEYYRFQSGGRLYIQSTVLPTGDQGAYLVGDPDDYGPGDSGFWSLDGLELFVRDMIRAADDGIAADDPFGDGTTLADFDDDDPFAYVIFVHSGSDWQSDIAMDSPNDVPTFFVTLGEPAALLSTDRETGESGELSECSVIPETTSQDGWQGSIAAALYHEFGHALGLADVYSTNTGLPQVGYWDLMDSGTNLWAAITTVTEVAPDSLALVHTPVIGVLPPSLGAWNKWFLGWVETGEVTGPPRSYELPAIQVPRGDGPGGSWAVDYRSYPQFDLRDPQVLRAGASPREYFLLENRWVPTGPRETAFDELFFQSDPETGVILYLGGSTAQGQDVNSGLYDYFMPAGGLLVWHVNRDRIEAGLQDNTVNFHGDGLRLVEADGISDMGVLDAYVLGWLGSAYDPFGGYTVVLDEDGQPVVASNGFQSLGVSGLPSSRAWDRSWTGFGLRDVRPLSSSPTGGFHGLMLFDGFVDPLVEGFPFTLPPISEAEAGLLGDEPGPRGLEPRSLVSLPTAGEPLLGLVDRAPVGWSGDRWQPVVFALRTDGQPALPPAAGLPPGGIARLAGPLAGPPVLLEDTSLVIFASVTGDLAALPPITGGTAPTWAWTVALGDTLAQGPSPAGDLLLLPAAAGELRLLTSDGTELGSPLALAAAQRLTGTVRPIAGAPRPAWAVVTEDGWFQVTADGSGLMPDPTFHPYGTAVPTGQSVRTALLSGDDGARLLVFRGGEVDAWDLREGDVSGRTAWRGAPGEPLVSEPAVADLDGNGRNDVVFLTAGRVHACQADGVPVTGFPVRLDGLFPLADSTRVTGPAVVFDADGDRAAEVYFTTSGGHLVGLDRGGALIDQTPFLWGDRGETGMAVGPWTTLREATDPHPQRVLWLLDAGGYAGPPLGRQFNNGRLVGYAVAGGVAAGGTSSEWLAAGGGFGRSGPVGRPLHLGAESPLQVAAGDPILYPNPLHGEESVVVRFYSAGGAEATFTLYSVEGEEIVRRVHSPEAGQMNELQVPVPGLVSGLYVGRLIHDGAGERQIEVMTLAVER
ncbi:MAG: hypothetical protein R6X25_01770 [Candidatus Krumholzibacteriia bacterium]